MYTHTHLLLISFMEDVCTFQSLLECGDEFHISYHFAPSLYLHFNAMKPCASIWSQYWRI